MTEHLRWRLRLLLAGAGAAGSSETALAGAWTQPQGESLQIATLSRETGETGVIWQADYWLEAGLAPGWGGHLKLESRSAPDGSGEVRTGFEGGLRRSFQVAPWAAVSVQGSYLGAEGTRGSDCSGDGFETRAAAGASQAFGARSAFVNVEAAWRSRGALCEGRLLEVAAGADISRNWRFAAKAWSDESQGSPYTKAELSLLRDIGSFSVGLGYRADLSPGLDERGVLFQVWARL